MPRRILILLPLLLILAPIALAAGRELAPRPLGPPAYSQHTPLVAYAGGRYLTVWIEALDRAGYRYLGAFSDADGKRISPAAFVVVPNVIAGASQLIGTGNSFALFIPLENAVQMLDIDLTGQVTATRLIPMTGFRYDPSVAWNGTHFAAVERTIEGARVVYFDRAGNITRSVDLPCRPIRHELLAIRTDVMVVATCDGGGLRADRIAADGSITSAMLDPAYMQPGAAAVGAPADSDGSLIAWSSPDLDWSLQTAIVSADGTVSAPRVIVQSGGQVPFAPLLLEKTTDGFLLLYTEHFNLRVAKLDAQGARIEINPGPQNSLGYGSSAATDGTDILVADIHYEAPFSRGNVRTRLVDTAAQVGAGEFVSIVPARQLAPAIGAGSGSLVAAWTEIQGTTSRVRTAHLAADGTVLGNAIVDPNASLASDDLAWNGSHYLTVILRNGQLRAQRIDAFGQRAGSPPLLANFPTNVTPSAAVIWSGDRWDVVWADGPTVFSAEIAADGSRTSWTPLTLDGTLPTETMYRTSKYDVALAHDGEHLLVAWTEGQVEPCQVTCIEMRPAFIAAIDRLGMTAGRSHRISDPYAFTESLSLARSDDEFVAVANQYDRRAAVMSLDSELEPIASRTFDGITDVTWDGSVFILASRQREQLTVRRIDASLVDGLRPGVTNIAPADTDNSPPSVAAAISGNAITGIQEVDGGTGARAVVYVEQDLSREPQRRRTVRR